MHPFTVELIGGPDDGFITTVIGAYLPDVVCHNRHFARSRRPVYQLVNQRINGIWRYVFNPYVVMGDCDDGEVIDGRHCLGR